MRYAPLFTLAGATLLVGCSPADVTCNVTAETWQGDVLTQSLAGTFVLSGQSSREMQFELLIEQPSDLGFVRIDERSYVSFGMDVSYDASQPPNAQLPPVSQTIFFVQDGQRIASDYPGSFSLPLATCDEFTTEGCCPAGATTCRIVVGVEYSRDDLIFPTVQLSWTTQVQLGASQCDGDSQLSLMIKELET